MFHFIDVGQEIICNAPFKVLSVNRGKVRIFVGSRRESAIVRLPSGEVQASIDAETNRELCGKPLTPTEGEA